MKLAAVALCVCLVVASVHSQNLGEMMLMSSLMNRGSGSSSAGSGRGANPLAMLGGSTPGGSNPLAAMSSSSSSSSSANPLAALMGGSGAAGMSRMAGGMVMGGADMSSLMEFYMCGNMRIPMMTCMMMMQQNM